LTIVSTTISFPSPPPSPLEGERGRVRGIRYHSCHSLSADAKVLLEKEDGKGRKWKKTAGKEKGQLMKEELRGIYP